MDPDLAEREALRLLETTAAPGSDIAVDGRTALERHWCYVFFWNSAEYLRTRKPEHSILGNAPIVVPKDGGEAFFSGTHGAVEELLDGYERAHGIAHGDQRELRRHGDREAGVGSSQPSSPRRTHDDERRLDHTDERGRGSARPR